MKQYLVVMCLGIGGVLAQGAQPKETRLTPKEQQLVQWVEQRKEALVSELTQHVEMNTATDNVKGINAYRDLLAKELKQLGFAITKHPAKAQSVLTCDGAKIPVAEHLEATRKGKSAKKSC